MNADETTVYGGDPTAPVIKSIQPVGTNGVCLILKTTVGVGVEISISIEHDTPETPKVLDVRDPAHVVAWFVQTHFTDIVGVAAMALQASLKAGAQAAVESPEGMAAIANAENAEASNG